ncbi:MAG: hypothetical protein LBD67_01220 [Candidatus Accumulibacter sp.]|jgi:hypothetical protein|nr:hypothetical protein [Accumulibacter sp.]
MSQKPPGAKAPQPLSPNERAQLAAAAMTIDACAWIADALEKSVDTLRVVDPLEVEAGVAGIARVLFRLLEEASTGLFDLADPSGRVGAAGLFSA